MESTIKISPPSRSVYNSKTFLTLVFVVYLAFDLITCSADSENVMDEQAVVEHQDSTNETDTPWDRKRAIEQILKSHDSTIPPDFEKDHPTLVTVQLFIVSFDSISETTMDYSITVFLRQSWTDQRLKYGKLDGVDKLELDSKIMNDVWVPDLYFINEKQASFHDITVPNKLMHIFPDGRALYSARISMTLSCDMNLQKFPFDSQICHITMESYSYSTKNIIFNWHDIPVIRRENLKLPQFIMTDNKNVDCTKTYVGTEGKYTCIRAEFYLSRNYGYYIAQVYVPSILVVILSWVSFWLDVEAVPARISLGLLTVLTMTTQSANARAHLPRVSYIKAIDVWMAMCLFFVFSALIQFAYVNVIARVERRRTMNQMNQAQGGLKLNVAGSKPVNPSNGVEWEEEGIPKRLFSKTIIGRTKARRLDELSRIIFPLIFAAFNIFYWLFYMLWKPDHSTNSQP